MDARGSSPSVGFRTGGGLDVGDRVWPRRSQRVVSAAAAPAGSGAGGGGAGPAPAQPRLVSLQRSDVIDDAERVARVARGGGCPVDSVLPDSLRRAALRWASD